MSNGVGDQIYSSVTWMNCSRKNVTSRFTPLTSILSWSRSEQLLHRRKKSFWNSKIYPSELKSSDSGLKLLGFVLSSSRAQQLCEGYYMNKVVFFMLMQVLQLCRKHEVTIDSSYASLVVAVCVLVGFARSLDPELSIMDAAIPCLFFYNLVGRIPGGIYGWYRTWSLSLSNF